MCTVLLDGVPSHMRDLVSSVLLPQLLITANYTQAACALTLFPFPCNQVALHLHTRVCCCCPLPLPAAACPCLLCPPPSPPSLLSELRPGDGYDRAVRLLNHDNRWKVRGWCPRHVHTHALNMHKYAHNMQRRDSC